MRTILLAAVLVPLVAAPALAQRGGRGGGGIGPTGAPAPMASSAPTMPTVVQVRERANVADLLVEKKRKLGLDDAAVDSLKKLAGAINMRNAPQLAVYDSVRTRMHAAQVGGGAGGEGREQFRGLGEAMRTLSASREADIPVVLALVPAEKQEEAKKFIADQEEDFRKAMGPRGGGRPGGRPGGPPEE